MRLAPSDVLARTAVVTLACLLGLAACSSKKDSPSHEVVDPTPIASGPTTATTTPTDPATTAPAPVTATTPGVPVSLPDRLLATSAVPGLNAGWHWQDGNTGPAGTDSFGACAKVDLVSIGATSVVQRTYFPPVDTDDNAAEQVADFPDAATAARAARVLLSWHDKCKAPVATDANFKVGPFVNVPAPGNAALWYLVSWKPAGSDELRFEAFGIAAQGTRIAVLRMDSGGQSFHYPTGHEPMVAMVRAAAAKLG